MKGTYYIYKNGLLVAKQENLITTFGQAYLLGYFANQNPNPGSAIAVGISGTTATLADLNLGFEFTRGPIGIRAPLNASNQVVLKASLDETVGGVIYELGLFPTVSNSSAGEFGTKMLATYDTTIENWSGGVGVLTNFRLSNSSLEFDASSGTTVTSSFTPFNEDLSGYSIVDQFALAYFINDAHAANITIQFQTDSADFFQYTFTPPTTPGFYIQNWGKSDCTFVGQPDWSNINTLFTSVTAGGTATVVQVDGLIIMDKDIYQDYGMISHAILPTPILKTQDETLDVEYVLDVTVNG